MRARPSRPANYTEEIVGFNVVHLLLFSGFLETIINSGSTRLHRDNVISGQQRSEPRTSNPASRRATNSETTLLPCTSSPVIRRTARLNRGQTRAAIRLYADTVQNLSTQTTQGLELQPNSLEISETTWVPQNNYQLNCSVIRPKHKSWTITIHSFSISTKYLKFNYTFIKKGIIVKSFVQIKIILCRRHILVPFFIDTQPVYFTS